MEPEESDTAQKDVFQLRLFITGTSSISVRAIHNLTEILDAHLKDQFDLEIIDIYQHPVLVEQENISAVPVLIKKFPLPARRLVGDMSDTNRVLRGLGLL